MYALSLFARMIFSVSAVHAWGNVRKPTFKDGGHLSKYQRNDYLIAFGPSRHRAWFVGLRPIGWVMGSRGRPVGGVLDAVFWASWGPPGGFLGAIWGPLGVPRGPPGGFLVQPGGVWGPKAGVSSLGPLLGRLVALLVCLGGFLGRLEAP